jgi:hypothetical protein
LSHRNYISNKYKINIPPSTLDPRTDRLLLLLIKQ